MKIQTSVFLLLALAIAKPAVVPAQEVLAPILGTAKKYEDAKARLDMLRNEVGGEGVIILVARLGDGEKSRKVNRERLYNVWSYLHHAGQFPESRIVKAEGERARGRGRVDLYAKGKLMLVLTGRRNGDIVGPRTCGYV